MFIVPCLLALTAGVPGCASTAPRSRPSDRIPEVGLASYYAHGFHGNKTAYGEIYDERALTAAHPTLPPGTLIQVTNLANGREVTLRVNDRGPWKKGRVIDVSWAAANQLGFLREGVARVSVIVVGSAR